MYDFGKLSGLGKQSTASQDAKTSYDNAHDCQAIGKQLNSSTVAPGSA